MNVNKIVKKNNNNYYRNKIKQRKLPCHIKEFILII